MLPTNYLLYVLFGHHLMHLATYPTIIFVYLSFLLYYIQELTAENLNLLVERIEVFDRAEADGEAEQAIRICYRFGGYIGERRFNAKVLRNTGGWERHRRKERKDDEKISFVS